VTYQEVTTPLAAGDCLLAFTDGVTEAGARSSVPQFQQSGLATFLTGVPATATPAEIVQGLLAALNAHVGATWPDDDTTVFCLRLS
jgi:serine phosphatase RsbU (regulator of sigma subunit)